MRCSTRGSWWPSTTSRPGGWHGRTRLSPITPCTRQRPASAARFSLPSADNYCSAVHGAKRLPRPPPPYWAAERLAPLLNAGMSSAPCSLPAARGHGCRRDPSCCRHAVAGGGGPGRKGRWSWGAAELRRAAEADDQGGRRAKRRPGGGRYFKHRPPLGPCRPLDQALASQIGCGLWSAARSYSSGGRGSAARRAVARARRRGAQWRWRTPEISPELSRSVLGEGVCWPEETTARRPASCLDL